MSFLLHPIGYESVTEVGPEKKKSRMHSPPFDRSHVNDMSKTATVEQSWVLQGTVYWANEIRGLLLLKGDSLTTVKPLSVWITANWKILNKMRIPHHLTRLLRNLYAGQEETKPDTEQ